MKHLCWFLGGLWLALPLPLPGETVLEYRGHHYELDRELGFGERVPAHRRAGLVGVWVWSERLPPRRIAANELVAGSLPPAPEAHPRWLRLTVAGDARQEEGGDEVLAAPVKMWDEVPEDLLPRWSVSRGQALAIPVDAGREWRLRGVGAGRGTWWQDVPAGSTAARLRPTTAGDSSLIIVGPEGEPVPEASLTLLTDAHGPRQRVVAQHRADAGGRIYFPSLPDAGELSLLATCTEHAPTVLTTRIGQLPRRLRLDPGATVVGRFVDDEGRPVAGVQVRAEGWVSEGHRAVVERKTESAGDGTFTLSTLPRGRLLVLAAASGWGGQRSEVLVEGASVDLGDLVLDPARPLPVRVTDDAGAPVAGARVRAPASRGVVTDAAGRAVLEDVGGHRPLGLSVAAPGHLLSEIRFKPPLPEELAITLRRATQVTGRLVDADGGPVAQGTARVSVGARYRDEALAPGGRFDLDLEPGHPARLTLRSPTTEEVSLRLAPGRPGEWRDLGDVRSPPGVRVHGSLLRSDDGQAVAGARVWCPRPSEEGEVVAWAQGQFVEARSGEDGSFEVSGLPARPGLLRVDAAGLARRHVFINPEPGAGVLNVGEVFLDTGAKVRIFADPGETGAAVARVDLRSEWQDVDMLTASLHEGEATVAHVPPGPATVTVMAGRELVCEEPIQVDEGVGRLDVDCRRKDLRVLGTVTVGGRVAGPGTVIFLPAQAPPQGIILNVETPGGLRQQQTFGVGRPQVDVAVQSDGSFATDRLRAGEWEAIWVPTSGAWTRPRPLNLPAAGEHHLALAFSPLVISGVVVEDRDAPVAGARVRTLTGKATAISQVDGSFVLTDLEPGLYEIVARAGERTSPTAVVEVAMEQEARPIVLVVAERPREEVEIVALDVAGDPAAGAFLFLEQDDGTLILRTADLHGRAVVKLQRPYPRAVRTAMMRDGRWAFGPWQGLDEARRGVLIVAQETGALRLESPQLRGFPQLVSTEGWDLSGLSTRLGARLVVTPEAPLTVHGIPAGTYRLSVGDFAGTLQVEGNELTELVVQ